MQDSHKKIKNIRDCLDELDCEAYLLSTKDEFLGEFISESKERLKWLSGFSGSNGYMLIGKESTSFLTDGRYLLQAKNELIEGIKVYDISQISLASFITNVVGSRNVAIDEYCYSISQIEKLKSEGVSIVTLDEHLVDKFWNREIRKSKFIEVFDIRYCGLSSANKQVTLFKELNLNKENAYFVADPMAVCWFLNIRGRDVVNTPILQSYLLINGDGSKVFFADINESHKNIDEYFISNNIKCIPLSETLGYLKNIKVQQVYFDPNITNYAFRSVVNKKISDPITKLKSKKNKVELANIEKAHFVDGVALTEFLYNLEENSIANDELEAVALLEGYREKSSKYIGPSFSTIMGADQNGAIIHYRADESSNRKFNNNSIILLDSGGQYYEGTTDVTRVVAMGNVSPKVKKAYSLVLKGHIALATAIFPDGTKGVELDSYARQFLWREGMDYAHGTGHGVGMFLNVHEGPHSIGKNPNFAKLEEGMIISNEPGYYEVGHFGIRLENLVAVKRMDNGFLTFKNLTLAPFSKKLIDLTLLTNDEISWLNTYHRDLVGKFLNKLAPAIISWIEEQII